MWHLAKSGLTSMLGTISAGILILPVLARDELCVTVSRGGDIALWSKSNAMHVLWVVPCDNCRLLPSSYCQQPTLKVFLGGSISTTLASVHALTAETPADLLLSCWCSPGGHGGGAFRLLHPSLFGVTPP